MCRNCLFWCIFWLIVHREGCSGLLAVLLPVGGRQVSTLRTMLTRDIAALLPFNVQELNEKGICYGINQVSHNLCIANRKNLANGNGMVFGIPGSGKSYFSKSEMLQVFLGTDDDIRATCCRTNFSVG